jgi:hypothetical protein
MSAFEKTRGFLHIELSIHANFPCFTKGAQQTKMSAFEKTRGFYIFAFRTIEILHVLSKVLKFCVPGRQWWPERLWTL